MGVLVEKSGKVCTVIIDRPEARNAVDRPTAERLIEAFEEFDTDESLRVAVLWGKGGYFCAGADLKAMADRDMDRVNALNDDMTLGGPMGPSRMRLSKPVIAAVAGHAVAGGLELACWCDLRVVEEDAVFGVFCRRFGVPLIDGGTQRLPRLIGMSRALDMMLTGRPVGPRRRYPSASPTGLCRPAEREKRPKSSPPRSPSSPRNAWSATGARPTSASRWTSTGRSSSNTISALA